MDTNMFVPLKSGVDGQVNAIKTDTYGNVFVGGNFRTAGSLSTGPFAVFNIYMNDWVPTGLDASLFSQGDYVNTIELRCPGESTNLGYMGSCDVFIGGSFTYNSTMKNVMYYANSQWNEFVTTGLTNTDYIPSSNLGIVKKIHLVDPTMVMLIGSFSLPSFNHIVFKYESNLWKYSGRVYGNQPLDFDSFDGKTAVALSDSRLLYSDSTGFAIVDCNLVSINRARLSPTSKTVYIGGEAKSLSSVYQCDFSPNGRGYTGDCFPLGMSVPETVISMELFKEKSGLTNAGSILVGGENMFKLYDPLASQWNSLLKEHGYVITEIAFGPEICSFDRFGASCQNHVDLLDVYTITPRVLNITNPVKITDGKQYQYLWTVGERNYTTNSLYIENPFSGSKSLEITFSVFDSSNSNLFEKDVLVKMVSPPVISRTVTYSDNLSFMVPAMANFEDTSNRCKVGIVDQKISPLTALGQFKNYTFMDVSCNSNSVIKVPYFGNPYTKFLLSYENAEFSKYSTAFNQREEIYAYFPTFNAFLANGTDISLNNSNGFISFSSVVHSNIPTLNCKVDLVVGKTTSTVFNSICTTLLNFTIPSPIQTSISTATLVVTLSNAEYFYEEKEFFEFELTKCSLTCQNGGVCFNSTTQGAFCKCHDMFIGDLCQDCPKGFENQFGKCVCPSGYEQVGSNCIKIDPITNNTKVCYGKDSTDSSVCSGHGNCISINTCECYNGYSGNECSYPVCFGMVDNACNGNGKCVAPDSCDCSQTYGGMECDIPKCNGKTQSEGGCSYHGTCNPTSLACECNGNFVGPSCSSCKDGFTGMKCDIPICNGVGAFDSLVCNGRGQCISLNGTTPSCKCNANYYGPNCGGFSCDNIEKTSSQVCSSHGVCTQADTCSCTSNYNPATFCSTCLPSFTGSDCSIRICDAKTTCGGKGQCNSQLECVCSGSFTGAFCEKCVDGFVGTNCDIACSAKTTCTGRGTCSSTGSCVCSGNSEGDHCESCKAGWYGDNCDFQVDINSFQFNENGDSIVANVKSTLKTKISCSSLITNVEVLGLNPICLLDGDKSLLTIQLGSLATIVINGEINVRVYIDHSNTVSTKVQGTYYKKVDPVAYLTSDTDVIGCGSMFLDASSSTSLDRRKLLFSFSVSLAPDSQSLQTLNSLISLTSSSIVKFSINNLSVGTYAVQVAVQSTFTGRTAYASYSFTITPSAPPQLTLKNGLTTTISIGSSAVITPLVSFPSCYSGKASVSSLKFIYSQVSGPTVKIAQQNELLVFSSDFTKLAEEGDYVFKLVAQEEGYPSASLTFKVTATALPLKLSFSIRDMSQSIEDNIKFTIITQDPSNPNDASGNIVLSCTNQDTLESCPGFPQVNTLSVNQKFASGTYLFTTVFTKNTRSATASVKVTVTSQSKATLLRLYIDTPVGVDLSGVDSSSNLLLQVQSMDLLTSQRQITWSSMNFNFDSTMDPTRKYLIIPSSLLIPGASYTVSVNIVDGEKTGQASLSFTVNAPPTLGTLEIMPSTGVALIDTFKVSCGNGWSDAQLPLSFKFMFRQAGETVWKVLKEKSETRFISTVLPSGNLEIKAIVYDALGAATETVKTIQVSNPVDVSSTIRSLSAISSTIVTSSSTSSALGVLQSMKATSESERAQLSSVGAKIVLAYFSQQGNEEKLTSQTASSTSSSISVISSVSTCVENLPEETVNVIITKFKSTVDGAYSKIILPKEDIDSSLESDTTIQKHVSKKLSSRSVRVFTQEQVTILDQIKETLINLQLKNVVPDMPAVKTSGSDFYAYVRLLSVPSLSNLNESVTSISSFSLSPTFSNLPQISSLDNVKVVMKVQKQAITGAVTKLLTFKLESASNEVKVSSANSSIANLVIEHNELVSTRAQEKKLVYSCYSMVDGKLTEAGCSIAKSDQSSYTINVLSTGVYTVVATEESITPEGMSKLELIALVVLIVPIIACIVVVLIVIVCCVIKKKKGKNNNNENRHIELATHTV